MDLHTVLNFNDHSRDDSEPFFPSLSFNERLVGFLICCAVGTHKKIEGYLIQLLSFGSFIGAATGDPSKFAILYSFGNIVALVGTGFLVGFSRQCQNMAEEDRRIASLIFLGSLVCTLLSAWVFNSKILVFIFVLIQIPAYIWYVATYIPFARDCIKGCLRGILDRIRGR